MAMNQTCYALTSTSATPFTLYFRVKQRMEEMVRAAHGSVFDTITTSTFRSTPFLIPSVESMHAFESRVTAIMNEVLSLAHEVSALTSTRDTLLPKLLSGELNAIREERAW